MHNFKTVSEAKFKTSYGGGFKILLKEICQLINSLYQAKDITKNVYNI